MYTFLLTSTRLAGQVVLGGETARCRDAKARYLGVRDTVLQSIPPDVDIPRDDRAVDLTEVDLGILDGGSCVTGLRANCRTTD